MMFAKGDIVLYHPSGVCEITDIREERMAGTPADYYILKPIYQGGSTIYVPVDNERLTARMRPLLSPAKVNALMAGKVAGVEWIEDSRERSETYTRCLVEGDRAAAVGAIRLLVRHKAEVAQTNHKFYATDEKVLSAAEKMIGEEFGYVLKPEPRDIIDRLTACIV